MKPTLEVLLSCMNEDPREIIKRSNLNKVNTLLINQNSTKIQKENIISRRVREIESPTRGLSVSRNIGIDNTKADVCLLADNDEIFNSNIEKIISDNYKKLKDADLIIFKVDNSPNKLGDKIKKVHFLDTLHVSSYQISFRTKSIRRAKIKFDKNIGAGTNNGAGEENKFLLDCLRHKLVIYYAPVVISSLIDNESTWFNGYDKQFFYNRGKSTRYIYGTLFSVIYGVYYVTFKHKLYKETISFKKALLALLSGIIHNDLKN